MFSTNGNFNGAILWETESEEHLSFDRVICSVNEALIEIPSELKLLIEGIKAERPELHDNLILRLAEEDICFENGYLRLNLGVTSYFRYQASKCAPLIYTNKVISMQVAGETCVFSRQDEDSYLIFSLRNSKRGIDDFYRYHSCAGVCEFDSSRPVIHPHQRAIVEVNEESGIPITDLKSLGISGIVSDGYFRRSAVLVKCETEQQLDRYFEIEPGSSILHPKFKTDEEVNLTALKWKPDRVKAFLLGQDSAYPFPLVRTFWLHVLIEGGKSFGIDWRREVEEKYKKLFELMRQKI